MANSNFDNSVERQLFLIGYDNRTMRPSVNESNNVWFYKMGADGKVYGIIKEGTKFYIKTTEQGKENLAESYEYIGGFNARKENEFSDYNRATKKLETKLMNLNESYDKKLSTSSLDMDRSKKVYANLTESARAEIDRVNQIFENSIKIGMNVIDDPESKGKSTGDNTVKNNAPFEEKASASLDKDPKFNGTVKGATENTDVKGVEKDLESDKKKTANSGSEKDYDKAHDDLDGESVVDKEPKGGKVVRVNEGLYEDPTDAPFESEFDEMGEEPMDEPIEEPMGDSLVGDGSEMGDGTMELPDAPDYGPEGDPKLGMFEDDSLESLLEQFESEFMNESDTVIDGEDAVLVGKNGPLKGTDGKDADWERIDEGFCDDDDEDDAVSRFCKANPIPKASRKEMTAAKKAAQKDIAKATEPEEEEPKNEPLDEESVLGTAQETGEEKSMQGKTEFANGEHFVSGVKDPKWERIDEAIDRMVKEECNKIFGKKPMKESLEQKIARIVAEEVTKLDAWGKHPRYRQAPFKTPANKEVLAGTAEKDWNDDSTKGEEPYGKQIGDGAPFNQTVDMLTDAVLANLKEMFSRK